MKLLNYVILFGSLLLPNVATAGPEIHDGLLFRLTNGPTDIESKGPALATDGDPALDGTAEALELMLGYVVSERLILHLAVVEIFDVNAEYRLGLTQIFYQKPQMSAVGVGVTWYSQTNFYLSATLLGASLQASDPQCEGCDADFQGGGLLRLALGKEWWVSDNWGLGLGFSLMGGEFIEGDDLGRRELGSGSIFLSATYN